MLGEDRKVLFGHCQITTNAWERMRGLLGHAKLADGECMWFATTSVHTFFMSFAIDVAFMDRKGKVIAVYEEMPPWRHSRIHFFARGVIEAPAGSFRKLNITKGKVLELCPLS